MNSRQWQDGATAEHWAAFPGQSSATLYENGKPIPGMVDWHNFRLHFPKDAVLARTISLAGRRLETQLLHFDGVDWRAYTFAWRDDQADADLVPADGAEKEVSDGKQKRVWQFQSRSQCMSCHSSWSEYALAFQPEQLNRPGPDGRNQLVVFTETGLIRRAGPDGRPLSPYDADSAAKERKLVDPADAAQPLEARARSYLHANCGHCHCEGGGGAVDLRLQFPVAVAEMKAVGVRPTRGDFGLPQALHRQAGRPVGEHPVFPHGQVRPRPDAAYRFRTAGRGGAEADRDVDCRNGRGRRESDSLAGRRGAGQSAGRPEVGPGGGADSWGAANWNRPSERPCWPRRRSSRQGRFAIFSKATCPPRRQGRASSARIPGPGPFWP